MGFTDFFQNHMLLCLAFAACLFLWVHEEWQHYRSGFRRVSPHGLVPLMRSSACLLWDLRDRAAFIEGHIAGSDHVPLHWFSEREEGVGKSSRIEKKAKDCSSVVLIGQADELPSACVPVLRAAGVSDIYWLEGGIDGWKREQFPLVKE